MLVSTDMTISGMFFHRLKMSYEWADASGSCQCWVTNFPIHSCFMTSFLRFFLLALWMICFIFFLTLSVSSNTVAPSSKWQLSFSSSAYLLASLNTDCKFLFFVLCESSLLFT